MIDFHKESSELCCCYSAMKIKHLLIFLLVVDLLLFVQVFASATSTQSNRSAFVHERLNDFVLSDGFKKYKQDHFPRISGSINTKVTIRNSFVVNVEIDSTNIRNRHFLVAFTNLLLNLKVGKSGEINQVEHRFIVDSR